MKKIVQPAVTLHVVFRRGFVHTGEVFGGGFFYGKAGGGHFKVEAVFVYLGNVVIGKKKIGCLIQVAVGVEFQHKVALPWFR